MNAKEGDWSSWRLSVSDQQHWLLEDDGMWWTHWMESNQIRWWLGMLFFDYISACCRLAQFTVTLALSQMRFLPPLNSAVMKTRHCVSCDGATPLHSNRFSRIYAKEFMSFQTQLSAFRIPRKARKSFNRQWEHFWIRFRRMRISTPLKCHSQLTTH